MGMRFFEAEDWLIAIQIVSNMLRTLGFFLIIPLLYSIKVGETRFTILFSWMIIILVSVFTIIKSFLHKKHASVKHAVIGLVLSWISISLVSTIPYLIANMNFIDSFFESVSGWTGTGLTMLLNPEVMPKTIIFWRAFTQWVGGFGIVIMALIFYESPKTAKSLFLAEGRKEDFYFSVFTIARIIIIIYLTYTIIGVILMIISGVPLYSALINVMTAIATGGYSDKALGVGVFGVKALLVIMLMMIIGGISFESHYKLFKGKWKDFVNNPEVKSLFVIIIISFLIISIGLWLNHKNQYFDSFFYVVSAITGTGHGSINPVDKIPQAGLLVIVFLMISGACYGSTTGAIKIWRTVILGKVIQRDIMRVFLPEKAIVPIKVGDKIIDEETALKATTYTILYVVLIFIGTLIFMNFNYPLMKSLFTIASAQGNVGLNIIPQEKFIIMNPWLKLQLIVHMFLGRLEIIPVLILLRSLFKT